MTRSCACRSPASAVSARGRAVSPSLSDAARCLAVSGGSVGYGEASYLAWCTRASADFLILQRCPNQCPLPAPEKI